MFLLKKNSRKYIQFRWSWKKLIWTSFSMFWLVLPHKFSQNKWKSQLQFCVAVIGWHSFTGLVHREDKHLSRHSSLLVTTSRFCNQLEKVSLTEEKIQKVKTKCQNLLTKPSTSILELTKVIDLLTLTIQAVLPARLQCWFFDKQVITCKTCSYRDKCLNKRWLETVCQQGEYSQPRKSNTT